MSLQEQENYLCENYGKVVKTVQEELKKDRNNNVEEIEKYTKMVTDILETALNSIKKLKEGEIDG